MDKIDAIIEGEAVENFEKLSEVEKEHRLFLCSDAKSEEEAMAAVREMKFKSMSDIIAAVANTDVGNTTENSGIR